MTTTSTSPPSSAEPLNTPPRHAALPGGVEALATGRRDGDLRVPGTRPARTPERHRTLVPREWALARQVHGAGVVVVDAPTGPLGQEADALVATHPDAAVAVLGADCPLVGFASTEGLFGVAHAGWRGLVAGVIEQTAAALRREGATTLYAVLSPCIHAECYEFGAADLAVVVRRLGDGVVAETAAGTPALDLPAAVTVALERVGIGAPLVLGGCTACGGAGFSARARGEDERHALVLWREAPTLS